MKAILTKLDSQLRIMLVRLPREQKMPVVIYSRVGDTALAQFLQNRAAQEGLCFSRLPLSGYWLVYARPAQILELAARAEVKEITLRPPRPAAREKRRQRAA